ncbi:NAD(P)-dependent oxidoreductase [Clostridia bacterium]|nr:NAD(P)-dependent oxidoreductase [Clostridia bacterium]
MRVLVLGCNGMAGHTISLYLHESGHNVFGFDIAKSQFVPSVSGDAKDQRQLDKLIGKNKYDTIINCIGILNQNAEKDKSLAVYLNSYLPHYLADITLDTDTQIIHMSTDCVFSGKRGQYEEFDYKDGESFYDRTKAIGELIDIKNLTLRNSIVGPDTNINGIGLLNWFLQQQGVIRGYSRVLWTGQTTLQLAKTMERAAYDRVHGLFNMVPNHSIDKYSLLKLFDKYFRSGTSSIIESDEPVVDKSLKRTCYDFNYEIPDYETMVSEMADWMFAHKELYPYYNLQRKKAFLYA